MIRQEDVYKIGRLGKPHGVKGEVSFQFSDDIFDRTDCDYLLLSLDGILVPFFIEEYRFRSNEVALVKFCDIDTQERAAQLTGSEVFFPRDKVPEEDDDTFTWSQLAGFTVINEETGLPVGTIDHVDDSTVNVLIETEDGRLLPAADEMIIGIDREKRELRMRLPEGLLDL